MYERNHIDGEVRKGKRSGAFCSTWFSGQSAYILQSYNGTMGDVFTQAHELGHAVHAYLGSRNQTPLNYRIGSCIAETGSIFGELLLTEKLLDDSDSDEAKRAVLAQVLDEFGMAAFQVSARVLFEKSMYDAIQKGELLDGEKVSALWVQARDTIYGDAVEWLDSMQWEWTMKIHYYIPNYRFYNYPYVFAQLFVYAMYRLYKVMGDEFVPRFKGLLAAGSSKPPRLLAEELGLDITKEDFWQKGIDQFEKFIDMFEETLA
jgi:oligoendopeptidase F